MGGAPIRELPAGRLFVLERTSSSPQGCLGICQAVDEAREEQLGMS
jgi:hypothetical protein